MKKYLTLLALFSATVVTTQAEVIEVTSATHLEKLKKEAETLIIDFFADWCGPCRATAPHFESVSNETASSNVVFAKVDLSKHKAIADAHHVKSIPTIIVVKKGKGVVATATGKHSVAQLRELVKEHAEASETPTKKHG